MGWLKEWAKRLPGVKQLVARLREVRTNLETLGGRQDGLLEEQRRFREELAALRQGAAAWQRELGEARAAAERLAVRGPRGEELDGLREQLAAQSGLAQTLQFILGEFLPRTNVLADAAHCRLDAPYGLRLNAVASRRTTDPISAYFLRGEFPPMVPWELLEHYLQPGKVVLDLGANLGACALVAAARGCRVIAVEAHPDNVQLLRASAAANQFTQLQVVHAAVSDRPGVLRLVHDGPYGLIAPDGVGDGGLEVVARTVDDILAELDVGHVDLVKMDIEGSEVAALGGMAGLLSRPDAPALFYESNGHCLNIQGQTCAGLKRAVSAFGYASYLADGRQLRPVWPEQIQPELLVDYLATKTPPDLPGWQIGPPLSAEELRGRCLAMAKVDFDPQFEHLARELAGAPAWLRADPAVRAAVRGPDTCVRAAA
jgi:FkbM family methyltransferase